MMCFVRRACGSLPSSVLAAGLVLAAAPALAHPDEAAGAGHLHLFGGHLFGGADQFFVIPMAAGPIGIAAASAALVGLGLICAHLFRRRRAPRLVRIDETRY